MTDKCPIILDGGYHKPLAGGDKISGSAIKVSQDAGNALTISSDGGLLVAEAEIASTFKKCSGLAHSPGASIPTCQEMQDAITAAIGTLPEDQFLQAVNYNPSTHTMTFVLAEGGTQYTVNLSDLMPVVVDANTGLTGNGTMATPLALITPEAAVPSVTQGTDIPTNIVGERTQILGKPAGWMTVNGKKVPYWN